MQKEEDVCKALNIYCLILIDFQERLIKHIEEANQILKNSSKIIRACKVFGIPILITEQKKLGNSVKEIRNLIDVKPIQKLSFSCMKCEEFYEKIKEINPEKCILVGIETHICILQTALDMLKEGYEVYVVLDCIGSRNLNDKEVAIQRMVSEGVKPVTSETMIYEIMRTAKHEKFKEILQIIKEQGVKR